MSLKPILVAEDNADDIAAIKRTFRKLHVKNPILSVASGKEAIRYLKGDGAYSNRKNYPLPALLLLDLLMTSGDGLHVMSWVNTQPKPDFPIVILTGLKDLKEMRTAYQLGAQSFLMKPLDDRDLLPLLATIKGIEIRE
ncbi:MAG TPA: response regulator [Verrucomicrobiae bacterium]|nr:response regulator [Verrucomicrobiae bacterium]